jgi:polysaccharide export outer membrane protein
MNIAKTTLNFSLTCCLAALALSAILVQSPVQAQQTNAPKTANELYHIGPGDVLEIRVFNRPQLSREAVRVDNQGMVRMPMIEGDIRAACQTESDLATSIATSYLKYQNHPHVDVFVKEYSSKPAAVIGAVDKPGQFQLQRRVRLLELVSLAGGPTERAGQRILIARGVEFLACDQSAASAGTEFDSYNLNETLRGDEKANPYVRSGDIITIPEAQQIFIVGNVFRPTSIALKERITVSQAVAMAGGTMPDSKKDRVRILRQAPGSFAKTEIIVDLNAVNKRTTEDIELLANDIVDVPTASGKRLLRSLISAVVPSVGNLPVRVVH